MTAPTQRFTKRELNWMRKWRSQAHLRSGDAGRPITTQEWDIFLRKLENDISTEKFAFEGLKWINVRNKRALTTNRLEDALVIRKINNNIRRAYGVRQSNRTELVQTAKQALSESAPKTVIRFDLKGCFESIDRNGLMNQLRVDGRVSTQTIILLENLFDKAGLRKNGSRAHGIPRGLVVSASLAEIKLRMLDRELKSCQGTYLVLRYVDDVLVFSTAPEKECLASIERIVQAFGFKLNDSKTVPIRIACSCEITCQHLGPCTCDKMCKCLEEYPNKYKSIEYLGYQFFVAAHNKHKKQNSVYCLLSDRKIARLKTRILHSIEDCASSRNWFLLKRRIQYLTSNQAVTVDPSRRALLSGISYTHPEYEKPSDPSVGEGNRLDSLDRFYRTRLRKLSLQIGKPTAALWDTLEKITFVSGFMHHRRTKFSALEVIEIKHCWEKHGA